MYSQAIDYSDHDVSVGILLVFLKDSLIGGKIKRYHNSLQGQSKNQPSISGNGLVKTKNGQGRSGLDGTYMNNRRLIFSNCTHHLL